MLEIFRVLEPLNCPRPIVEGDNAVLVLDVRADLNDGSEMTRVGDRKQDLHFANEGDVFALLPLAPVHSGKSSFCLRGESRIREGDTTGCHQTICAGPRSLDRLDQNRVSPASDEERRLTTEDIDVGIVIERRRTHAISPFNATNLEVKEGIFSLQIHEMLPSRYFVPL